MPDINNNQANWEMYQPDLTSEHPRHQRMLEPLISLYQDGEANEVESATVEQYLSACAECRAINASFQNLSGNLRSYMEDIPARRFNRQAYAFLDEGPALQETSRMTSPHLINSGALPDDRLRPVPPRRAGFAYNLAGGLAAALLIGLVAAFLLLVSQQVSLNKENIPNSNQAAIIASQSLEANRTPQTESSPTAATPTPEPAVSPAVPSPQITNSVGLPSPAITPAQRTQQPLPTVAAQTAVITQKATATVSQKPAPTFTPVPVPTNTPSRTSVAVPPTATPTQPVVTTAAPVETVASTPEPTVERPTALATTPVPSTTVTAPATVTPTITTPAATSSGTSSTVAGWIAYVDQSDGQIHLVKADGRDDQVISDPTVSRNFVYEQLVWSNDGKLLAAVGQNTNNGVRSVYLLDIANPLRVEALAEGFAPSWSPDNLSIAFLASPVTLKDGVRAGRPAIYSLLKRTVSYVNTLADSLTPQWFEDNSRLLIGQDRIYNLDSGLIGTFKLPFTNICLGASLSPAGDKLANLELQTDGNYQTVIYDLSKGQLDPRKPLARSSAPFQGKVGIKCGSQRIRWTPDSRTAYYYVNNGPAAATCLVQANGSGARCLNNVYDPSFNSDASALVDVSLTAGGDGQVYTTASNVTARPIKPKLIAESIVSPVWQPL